MIKKALAATVISLGFAVAAAPFAHADAYSDNYLNAPSGPDALTIYWNQTFSFNTPLDPGAFDAGNPRSILLSPFGTTHPIDCRGADHYGRFCRQADDAGVDHVVQAVTIGQFKTFWVYNPIAP